MVARKFLPEAVEQWGKLRRLEGGDIMHAHDIVPKRMDGRDASFIRVRRLMVDLSSTYIYFYVLPKSMSNLLIGISTIEMFPKISSYKRSSGNFGTSSSSPFPKARNLKRGSLKLFVSRLFGKFMSFYPTLMRYCRFRFTGRLGPWTRLTSNRSSVLLAVLKTGENGGWSTAVARWHTRYSLRWISSGRRPIKTTSWPRETPAHA